MATTLFPPEVLIDQPTQIYGKDNVYYLYFSFSQFNLRLSVWRFVHFVIIADNYKMNKVLLNKLAILLS